jgi:hypothetical protein
MIMLSLRTHDRCSTISTLVPRRDCFVASLLAIAEKGRAFSGPERKHREFVGVGFSSTGYICDVAMMQRFRAHPRVKLHISLKCVIGLEV